ncbi:MAG TPA: TPM domain-containing protein [Tepiditoga sp.]|nr:TPM domain-containing protein [Tepiditoga sp.]
MKKIYLLFVVIFIASFIFSWDIPKYDGYLNDYLGWFSEKDKTEINGILNRIESETSVEIAVVTMYREESMYPKEMATEIFNTWGIGKKEKDNGLLILVTTNPPTMEKGSRVEVETGYGLEGILPDGKVGRLMDDYMMEYFYNKKYGSGIISFLGAIEKELKGEGEKYTEEKTESKFPLIPFILFFVFFDFVVFIIIISNRVKCPKCGKNMKVLKYETIVEATTSSSGRGIKHCRCKYCGETKDIPYAISPKGSSSSGGSSSSSSSSSSFGGGSSGGGGAGRSF